MFIFCLFVMPLRAEEMFDILRWLFLYMMQNSENIKRPLNNLNFFLSLCVFVVVVVEFRSVKRTILIKEETRDNPFDVVWLLLAALNSLDDKNEKNVWCLMHTFMNGWHWFSLLCFLPFMIVVNIRVCLQNRQRTLLFFLRITRWIEF